MDRILIFFYCILCIVNLNTQLDTLILNYMKYWIYDLHFCETQIWQKLNNIGGRQNKVYWLKIKLELAKLKFDKLWAHSIPIVNIIGLLSSKAHVWTKFGDWVRRKSENWWKYGIEDVFDDALYNKEENFS